MSKRKGKERDRSPSGAAGRRRRDRAHKVRCPRCGVKVNEDALEDHLKEVHGTLVAILSENKRALAYGAFLVVVLVAAYLMITLGASEEEGPEVPPPPVDWLDTYTPRHSTGSMRNDWWSAYPDGHPTAGAPVSHPSWVTAALATGPLIILDHSEGCAPCVAQTRDVEAVLANFHGRITYMDILADGSDQRAYEAFDAYDPNGDPPYIPLTVIVTRVRDGSGTRLVWHSSEGATGTDWIEGYVKDAIYYYGKSAGAGE